MGLGYSRGLFPCSCTEYKQPVSFAKRSIQNSNNNLVIIVDVRKKFDNLFFCDLDIFLLYKCALAATYLGLICND